MLIITSDLPEDGEQEDGTRTIEPARRPVEKKVLIGLLGNRTRSLARRRMAGVRAIWWKSDSPTTIPKP